MKVLAKLIEVNGGYVVQLGTEFIGVDGYWARTAEAANPFKLLTVAQDLVADFNDRRRGRWEV